MENNAVTGGENDVSGGEEDVIDNGRPRCNVGTYKDGPAKIWRLPIDGESYELVYLIDITRNGNIITLLHEGLIKRNISALGLDSKYSIPVDTPAKNAALGRDLEGQEASGSGNYASVIGMLLYLGHSRPDISFATHQCA